MLTFHYSLNCNFSSKTISNTKYTVQLKGGIFAVASNFSRRGACSTEFGLRGNVRHIPRACRRADSSSSSHMKVITHEHVCSMHEKRYFKCKILRLMFVKCMHVFFFFFLS